MTWQTSHWAAASVCLQSSARQEPFLSHTALQLLSTKAQYTGYDAVHWGQRKEKMLLMSAVVVSLSLTADGPVARVLSSKSEPEQYKFCFILLCYTILFTLSLLFVHFLIYYYFFLTFFLTFLLLNLTFLVTINMASDHIILQPWLSLNL